MFFHWNLFETFHSRNPSFSWTPIELHSLTKKNKQEKAGWEVQLTSNGFKITIGKQTSTQNGILLGNFSSASSSSSSSSQKEFQCSLELEGKIICPDFSCLPLFTFCLHSPSTQKVQLFQIDFSRARSKETWSSTIHFEKGNWNLWLFLPPWSLHSAEMTNIHFIIQSSISSFFAESLSTPTKKEIEIETKEHFIDTVYLVLHPLCVNEKVVQELKQDWKLFLEEYNRVHFESKNKNKQIKIRQISVWTIWVDRFQEKDVLKDILELDESQKQKSLTWDQLPYRKYVLCSTLSTPSVELVQNSNTFRSQQHQNNNNNSNSNSNMEMGLDVKFGFHFDFNFKMSAPRIFRNEASLFVSLAQFQPLLHLMLFQNSWSVLLETLKNFFHSQIQMLFNWDLTLVLHAKMTEDNLPPVSVFINPPSSTRIHTQTLADPNPPYPKGGKEICQIHLEFDATSFLNKLARSEFDQIPIQSFLQRISQEMTHPDIYLEYQSNQIVLPELNEMFYISWDEFQQESRKVFVFEKIKSPKNH